MTNKELLRIGMSRGKTLDEYQNKIKELESDIKKKDAQLELLNFYEFQRDTYRKRCNKIINYITEEIEDEEFVETPHYTEILDIAKGGRDDKSIKA
jgi:hypothetical protein